MLDEILESPAFYILTVIGYLAFVFMLVILKGMGNSEIMPLWVKIVVMIAIPVGAALFTGVAEG